MRRAYGTVMETASVRRTEVNRVALISLGAAATLTVLKIIVGIASGSLGVISEALHSLLDLLAAGITVAAVRQASVDPDPEHPYGHGKIENFAAFVQTVLLWVTAGWIIWEALRVIGLEEWPEPTLAGIVVMTVSIIVNFERARVLYSTAEKHGSQALEADGLHFITDSLSSVVVLIGLIFVFFGVPIADPLSAIGVALVILFVSFKLAKRAFDVLLDTAPSGIYDEIEEICSSIHGVVECRKVRARQAGPDLFLDVVIAVEENTSFEEAHHVADRVERALLGLGQRVDCMVHIEPVTQVEKERADPDVYGLLQDLVRREVRILGIHKVRIQMMEDGTYIAADLEMEPGMTIGVAHAISEHLEQRLQEKVPNVKRITLHMDVEREKSQADDITSESGHIVDEITLLVNERTPAQDCHNVNITRDGLGLTVSLDCRVDAKMSLVDSHEVAERVEKVIREAFPDVGFVFVHVEPS
ncbi:MAG: cation-efflux pump [Candidatus Thorarchaeota archaeon]